MLFDARQIARGWLAVGLASSSDDGRAALNRTIHVEQHLGGVRLVATDSYVLLHSWVPDIEHELDAPPEIDEAPMATATAIDPHGRARGFLAHALKLAAKAEKDNGDPIEVRLGLNVLADMPTANSPFPGMEARAVVVEQPDVERVTLDVYDGSWPAWRSCLGHIPRETDRVALNPEIVGRLAKVGKIHPACYLGWSWGGENKPAHLTVVNSDPHVEGLVMPCRWDFDANAPRVDAPEADQVEDDAEQIATAAP